MVLNMAISSQSQWGNTCCNSVGAIMIISLYEVEVSVAQV